MTNDQFEILVTKLERVGAEHPGRYKLRVFLLAVLGYGFLFAVLLTLAGVIAVLGVMAVRGHGSLLAIKAILPLLVAIGLVVRALWVKLDPPQGIRLTQNDFPQLFGEIGELRRKFRGPRLHEVLLDAQFNAAIVQQPRLGAFGWQKNYLLLGMPLMQALSPEQFRAVLGHEYGHLAGAHGKFSAWIYRLRKTWEQLLGALKQREGWMVTVFKRFFNWYSPFFSAYTFVLARAQEYEADRCAVLVAGAESTADALVNVSVKAAYIERCYWPGIYGRVEHEPEPFAAPHGFMPQGLDEALRSENLSAWLDAALQRVTSATDTHPALADRLKPLGVAPRLPRPLAETAAQAFLGAALPALAARLDSDWKQGIAQSWKDRYQYLSDGRQRLAELHQKAGSLTVEESRERAYYTEELESADGALPLYREVLDRAPDDPFALFAIGRILLSKGEAQGMALIEKAIAHDPDLTARGSEWIAHYLETQGREDESNAWRERLARYHAAQAQVNAERDFVRDSDTLLPHALSPRELEALREQLAGYTEVARAYLVRKALQYYPERPVYVLMVAYSWRHAYLPIKRPAGLSAKLAQEITFPGETLVMAVNATKLTRKVECKIWLQIRKVEGSLFYKR